MSKKRNLIFGLVGTSIIMALYELAAYIYDIQSDEYLLKTSSTIFLVLLIMWLVEDSKSYKNVYVPYDFGFLVFLYWLPYLPYYFFKTRGVVGLVYLVGLLFLLKFGLLLQWGYYYAS
ncbi:MAG: hypothetical protein ABW201_16600 [Candidatus Thiodiazotropha sp.]